MMPNSTPSRAQPEAVFISALPKEAREVGFQPMRCRACGHAYDLPLYEMPDGPIVTIARCPSCRDVRSQVPDGVAL